MVEDNSCSCWLLRTELGGEGGSPSNSIFGGIQFKSK